MMPQLRDRVVELRRVKAGELRPHPKNWRLHPPVQQEALRGVLAEIGYADALLARLLPDGSLQLVDGHLRARTTPDMEVPVLVLDLNDEEAEKLLTVLDPLAGLAEVDFPQLSELLDRIHTHDTGVAELLNRLEKQAAARQPIEQRLDALQIGAVYQLLVECQDEEQQRKVYELLQGQGLRCRVITL